MKPAAGFAGQRARQVNVEPSRDAKQQPLRRKWAADIDVVIQSKTRAKRCDVFTLLAGVGFGYECCDVCVDSFYKYKSVAVAEFRV